MRLWNSLILRLGAHGLGILNYESFSVSGEKHLIEVLLPQWLGTNPVVVFDVGAHVGSYAAAVSRAFPAATIHAFEPNPRSYSRFEQDHYPNVQMHAVGLGAEPGSLELFDRADIDGSSHASLYSDVISEIHQQDVTHTTVQITTLDDVTSALGIRQIDFLKVDVEGHEIQVLQGGGQLIASDSIRYVQFEFNEMNVVSGTTMRDFRLALPRHQLFRLLPKGLIPLEDSIFLSELYAHQNIIAVPVGDLDDTPSESRAGICPEVIRSDSGYRR